uniref:Uncharacterized protein n=1 Tax=Arundo donax TaxID=35708 RepID=A0A0A9CGZ8_ARUDO
MFTTFSNVISLILLISLHPAIEKRYELRGSDKKYTAPNTKNMDDQNCESLLSRCGGS